MPIPVKLPVKAEQKEEKAPEVRSVSVNRIINNITFFGDSAITKTHKEYQRVYDLAKYLASRGYVVVNGGGPGVMEAATAGAEEVDGHTVAIYWEPKLASHFEGKDMTNHTDESESYSNYMIRTLGLIEKGQVYIVCKGGTGTISEFGMVWALAKLYFGRHKPVILFGDFWRPIVDSMIENMLIDDEEKGVLYYAETSEEVFDLITMFEEEAQTRSERSYEGDETAFIIDARKHETRHSYNRIAKLYHNERVGNLVAQEQLDEFMELVPEGRVLDIGTGPGYDLGYLSQKYKMHGVEISKEFVNIARFENPEAEIVCSDIVHTKLEKEGYVGIWSRDAIHHIPEKDLDHVFQKLSDALVPGGILYLIVQRGEGETVMEEDRDGYKLKRFYHYFTEEEIKKRAVKSNFTVEKIETNTRSHEWLVVVLRKNS